MLQNLGWAGNALGGWAALPLLGHAASDDTVLEFWLPAISVVVVLLLAALLLFALIYRSFARNSTRPCPCCMEFIPKRATVCPRCGRECGKAPA